MLRIIPLVIAAALAGILMSCWPFSDDSSSGKCESHTTTPVYDSISRGKDTTLTWNQASTCGATQASAQWEMYGPADPSDYLELQVSTVRLEVTGHCESNGKDSTVTKTVSYPTSGMEITGLSFASLCGEKANLSWKAKVINNTPVKLVTVTAHIGTWVNVGN